MDHYKITQALNMVRSTAARLPETPPKLTTPSPQERLYDLLPVMAVGTQIVAELISQMGPEAVNEVVARLTKCDSVAAGYSGEHCDKCYISPQIQTQATVTMFGLLFK